MSSWTDRIQFVATGSCARGDVDDCHFSTAEDNKHSNNEVT